MHNALGNISILVTDRTEMVFDQRGNLFKHATFQPNPVPQMRSTAPVTNQNVENLISNLRNCTSPRASCSAKNAKLNNSLTTTAKCCDPKSDEDRNHQNCLCLSGDNTKNKVLRDRRQIAAENTGFKACKNENTSSSRVFSLHSSIRQKYLINSRRGGKSNSSRVSGVSPIESLSRFQMPGVSVSSELSDSEGTSNNAVISPQLCNDEKQGVSGKRVVNSELRRLMDPPSGSVHKRIQDASSGDETQCKQRSSQRLARKPRKAKRKFKDAHLGARDKVKCSSSALDEVRKRLHASAIPNSLPCREDEFDRIEEYARCNIIAKTSGCLYISGVPGTGKTAVVHQAIASLRAERECPTFVFVEVNGMKLTEPNRVFFDIFKQLCPTSRTSPSTANRDLYAYFASGSHKRPPVVLLIDELDLLWTKKQDVLYQLLDLPAHSRTSLTIITIANTMDLPERAMIHRVSSRLGMIRMSFQCYTFQQLELIVQSRLEGLDCADAGAIQLVARKIGAVSGDARRALELCRRAAEEALRAGPDCKLSIRHVNAALKSMTSATYILAIKHASHIEQLFLRSVVLEFRRTGIEECVLKDVMRNFDSLCYETNVVCPGVHQLAAVCERLSAMRLLVVCGGGPGGTMRGWHRKLRLNVTPEDVEMALRP